MRIDIHTHLYGVTPEEMLAEMKTANIDKAVLLPIDMVPSDIDQYLQKAKFKENFRKAFDFCHPKKAEHSEKEFQNFINDHKEWAGGLIGLLNNDAVRQACLKYPDKFIGFGSVSPWRTEKVIEEKFDKFVEWGFKGIKLLPTLQCFNPEEERMNLIYDLAMEAGMVLLMHTGCDPSAWEFSGLSEYAHPKYLAGVAKRYPDLKIVAAHMASYSAQHPGIWFKPLLETMERYPNIYTDISAVHTEILKKSMDEVIELVGIERILFGSDHPAVRGCPMSTVARIIDNLFEETENKKIMGENASFLIKL